MRLSFSTLGCPAWSVEQVAEKAYEYGFNGVELRIRGKQHVDPAMTHAERVSVRQLFLEKHLDICCLAGYSSFCSLNKTELERNKQLMVEYIRLARDLGAPCIRTFVGHVPDNAVREQVIANASAYLRECAAYARDNGIEILIETHDDFSQGRQVRDLLEAVNSEGIAAIWDIHHTVKSGETPEETIRCLGGYIRHVHIKDSSGETDCLPGKGILPLDQAIRLLKEYGYPGYYSFEWEKTWKNYLEEPEIALPQYIQFMKGFCDFPLGQ